MLTQSRCIVAACAALALLSCVDPLNTLEGSIDDVFDLSFSEVRIRKYVVTNEVQIEYIKPSESQDAKDVVAQVTVTTPEGGFEKDKEYDVGELNGRVHRIAPGDDYPPMEEGTLSFAEGGNEPGEQTRGEFSVRFVNKRTLRGTFNAELEEAKAD